MAQTSYLWDNPGVGDSPAGGYGNATLCRVVFRMLFNGSGNQGVLLDWLNNLEVTDGGGLNAAVDTGAAMCYGVWFESDAAATVALPNNSTVQVVVRADWATQTARLAQVAALVQNPGVTYDIPLAEVTTVAGAITLVTDTRDYCELPTVPWPFGVTEGHLQADAVTTDKLIDQTRWLDLGSGALEPDTANPCTWTNQAFAYPYRDAWSFADAATNGGWIALRVPADFVGGGTLELHVRTNRGYNAAGDVRWCYNAFTATPGGVIANVAACTTVTYPAATAAPYNTWMYNVDALIGSIAGLAAGDLVYVQIYRDGTAGADNLTETVFLHLIRAEYPADS